MLARWQTEPTLRELTAVLCHEPEILNGTGEILTSGIQEANSRYSTHHAVAAATELLTVSPDRFSAAQFTPLLDEGIPPVEAINLLTWCAFCGWLNRLKIALNKGD
ncbi:hypothetical protein D3C76_1081910 [compost metagenome]